MGDNDVEMEVAQKNAHDSGNNVEESEGKVFNDRFENKGEELPSAVTVAENVLKCENDGEDINKLNSEAEERIPFEREIDNQTYHETETDKAMYVDCSTAEKINNINESEQRNNRAIISEDLSVPRSTSDEPTDSKNYKVEHSAANGGLKEEHGVVEQKVANGGLTKEKSTDNGREAGEPAQNSEGNEDGAKEKTMGTVKEEVDFVNHVASKAASNEKSDRGSDNSENGKSQTELSSYEAPQAVQNVALDEIPQSVDKEMEDASIVNEDKAVNNEEQQNVESLLASPVTDGKIKTVEAAIKHESDNSCLPKQPDAVTPNSVVIYSPANDGDHNGQTVKTVYSQAALPPMGESDDGTPEDQAAFMSELESFYREKAMEFKPPKFYGQPLNCLKLWRAVIRLGGYDRVTGSKLWRQVGESFNPPKTCTTVSWTFRIFYEKSLLEFERHKRQMGDLQLPVATFPEASGADSEGNGCQGSGSGRARRDAAARAMQGWHVQRLSGNGEVGEPVIKDKSINNAAKREKNMKSIGSLKQKRPNEVEHTVKVARTETSKQLASSVVDIGPPADWVKINVRQTKDCFEVYALIPGLLREEVRVQSDPAGRLVITGQPEQADNPWGITPFKKVVSLPARIDPLQTSAVVSLHGRLFVRVPFELSNA